ncbi:hypothetical protein Peur_057298 [Populus x canadensis]
MSGWPSGLRRQTQVLVLLWLVIINFLICYLQRGHTEAETVASECPSGGSQAFPFSVFPLGASSSLLGKCSPLRLDQDHNLHELA